MLADESGVTDFIDLDVPLWAWSFLVLSVVGLLAVDLWRHRNAHAPSFREAAIESAVWVSCALAFAGFVLAEFGGQASGEYLGVYLTEKSLSVDNVFVWSLLFSSMAIPLRYQHRVLFWGIFGALSLRTLFILLGAELVDRFANVLVLFGLFLVYTGIKIIRHRGEEGEDASTAGLTLLRRVVPVTERYDGQRFFTRIDSRLAATPLFAALVVVEATDLVFAFDSVPASFGVANEPFILVSANAFAIMGLRAMYFLLAGARERFHYLSHALGAILLFVGVKLVLTPWYHMPITYSLGAIVAVLAVAVVLSLWRTRRVDRGGPPAEPPIDPGIDVHPTDGTTPNQRA